MKIEADSVVPFPISETFRAYRDHLPELVDHLPNVKSVEVESREESGAVVKLVNVWHGGGEVPVAVRKFVGEDMLSWHDYATWNEDERTCEWNIRTHAFTDAVRCHGTNRFVEIDEGRTRVEIQGELDIDVKRVKGVPSVLAGSIGSKVEKFLVNQITANLTDVSDGLTRYLQSRG
ncbi:MAG: SRPBCC family protein [Polyangiales bacterium]